VKRIVGGIVVAAIVVAAGWWIWARIRAPKANEQVQYKLGSVEVGTVKKTVSATGILKPWRTVDIKSKAGGRVDALLVDIGSRVSEGQVLAKIDPTDTQLSVGTAKADVDSAEARKKQNEETYELQRLLSALALETAQAQLTTARASREAARSRLSVAQNAAATQPALSQASIAQAQASQDTATQQRAQLKATQAQERASAQAALDQAEANRRKTSADLARYRSLLERGFAAKQSVDSAEASDAASAAQVQTAGEKVRTLSAQQAAEADAADARVKQAQAQLSSAQAQAVDVQNKKLALAEAEAAFRQTEAQLAQAQTAVSQAKANMANVPIRKLDIETARASKARSQATLTNALTTLSQTTVRAPADGVILTKYVEEGTIISSALSFAATGNNILQLGDITRMYVDVNVDETDIASVDEGQDVEVTIDAYPSLPFQGVVARIDPQAVVDQNVTSVHVRVEIDNSDVSFRLLKPGMNATCEFLSQRKDDVLMVTNEAVRTDDQGQYVELALTKGKPAPPDAKTGEPADPSLLVDVKIRRQPVEAGLEGNDSTEITKGLKPGDQVVVQKIEPEPETASSPFGGGGPGPGMRGMGRMR
jgi:HlyD family secretion protein